MFESNLCLGFLGINPSSIKLTSNNSSNINNSIVYRILSSTDRMDVGNRDLAGIIHRTNNTAEISQALENKCSHVKYALFTDLAPDAIPSYLLDQCDMLCNNDMTPAMISFYMDKFLRIVKAEREAWMNKNCLEILINMLPDLVWFKDFRGAHLNVNDAFCKLVKKEKSDIIGRGHYYIWGLTEEQYAKGEFVCMETEREIMTTGKSQMFREHVLGAKGTMRQLKTYKGAIRDINGRVIGTVGLAHDVTQQDKYRNKILRLVRRDFLTGMANRRYLYSFIRKNWRAGKITIMYCDLDGFKQVNDTYGHSAGDEALIAMSKIFKEILDETMVARVGGDEFLVAYIGNYRMEDLINKCEALAMRINTVFSADDRFKNMSVSIGLADGMYGEQTIDDIMTHADRAMYKAKETKHDVDRNCYHVYNPETDHD